MSSKEEVPTPPDEPSPDDCCGSGCATCVWDVYDQQVAQYKKDYEEYMAKFMKNKDSSAIPGKIQKKKVATAASEDQDPTINSSSLSPEEEEMLKKQQELIDAASDDDEDDEDVSARSLDPRISSNPKLMSKLRNVESFFDPNHNIANSTSKKKNATTSTASSSAASTSRYDGAVVVHLSTPPESVALRTAVVPREHFLTFRKDSSLVNTPEENDSNTTSSTKNNNNLLQQHEFVEAQIISTGVRSSSSSLKDQLEDFSVPYTKTTLKILSSSAGGFDDAKKSKNAFLPGDTVEVLRIPPKDAVESFLQYLAFGGSVKKENVVASEDGVIAQKEQQQLEDSLEEKRRKFTASDSLNLSNGVMCDISDFPFVDSPLPPWLEKCSSMKRTQRHPELETSQQTLPLGHMLRTVVDVYSWAAIQRPVIGKLLDVAESRYDPPAPGNDEIHLTSEEKLALEDEKRQVEALRALSKLSLSLVHVWLRLAWFACFVHLSTSNPSSSKNQAISIASSLTFDKNVALLDSFTSKSNTSQQQENIQKGISSLHDQFPPELLDYPLPMTKSIVVNDNNGNEKNNMGSIEFLLRCFPIVKTELFPVLRTNFNNDSSSSKKKKRISTKPQKVFSLARALEVLPSLKGRQFSIADTKSEKDREEITLFSNFKKILVESKEKADKVPRSSKATGKDVVAKIPSSPPWSGMVSSTLFFGSSSTKENTTKEEPLLFLRIPPPTNLSTKQKLQNSVSPSPSSSELSSSSSSFKQALVNVNSNFDQYQQQQQQEEQMAMMMKRTLLLSAGTGFAPFHFFLSKYLPKFTSSAPSCAVTFGSSASSSQKLLTNCCKHHISLISGFRHPVSARFLLPHNVIVFMNELRMKNNNSEQLCIDLHLAASRSSMMENVISSSTNTESGAGDVDNNESFLKVHPSSRVVDVAIRELFPVSTQSIISSDSSSSSTLDIFTCGPPGFVKECKNKIEEAIQRNNNNSSNHNEKTQLFEYKNVRWFNDDWSS